MSRRSSLRNEDSARMDGELIRMAVVESVDLAAGRCTVQIGELITGPLPWLAGRAGKTRKWSPPSIGEQVTLLCPEGDIEAGLVLCAVFSDSFEAPSSEDIEMVEFEDGAVLSYKPATHELKAILPGGGKVHIVADQGVTIDGPLTVNGDTTFNGDSQVNGDVAVSQTLNAQTDVVGGGKSLKGHKHTGVQGGAGVSGPPQ